MKSDELHNKTVIDPDVGKYHSHRTCEGLKILAHIISRHILKDGQVKPNHSDVVSDKSTLNKV